MKIKKEKIFKTVVTACTVSVMAFNSLTYAVADTDITSYNIADTNNISDTIEDTDIMPYAATETTYYYGPLYVDSNSWTDIDTKTKTSDHIYLSVRVGKMWECDSNGKQGDVATYENLYARFLSGGQLAIMTNSESQNIVDIPQEQGGGKGVLLTKEVSSVEKLRTNCQNKDVKIKFQEMGHNPKLDCYAKGYWNPDRKDN